MYKLVLLRHGESNWNKGNLFTGWTDVDLSQKGVDEAKTAGQLLLQNGYTFDIAYVSVLKRALRTLWIALDESDQLWIPWQKSWRLNERHYGALQGLNKKEMAEKVGKDQVHTWRRSYKIKPPLLTKKDERFPGHERMYHDVIKSELPLGESLEDTLKRFLPYWFETIVPAIKAGKRVIISAHGNSLRALVKVLDNIPDDEIPGLEIPTGKPLIYELNESLNPVKHYYLEA